MIQAPSYSKTATKKETAAKLDPTIFGVEPNQELLNQAYNTYLANGRSAHASTLRRGEVSGGGRKPHRQKGTGRARVGSNRVPQWRGGGITFGPHGEANFTKDLPTKTKRVAIRQALSVKLEAIRIIETFNVPEGKAKAAVQLLDKLKLTGTILVVVETKDALVDRATRNIAGVKAVQAQYLNVFDIMNADVILISEKALDLIGDWLGKDSKAKTVVKTEPTKMLADTKPAVAEKAPAKKSAFKKPADEGDAK